MGDFIEEKKKKPLFEHEHPLNLMDLWLEHEEEYEEEEEENEDELSAKQAFRCLCFRCKEEINWFHRYYYTCSQCDHSIHEFCMELPEWFEDSSHDHTLYLCPADVYSIFFRFWSCYICHSLYEADNIHYRCPVCSFRVDISCAMKRLKRNIIHHPSHKHPLTFISKQILCECDACGKEHKGFFYHCNICPVPFIHIHCAFLPIKLQIQQTTNDFFFHIHPLTIAYSFLDEESVCRVCLQNFIDQNLWVYKCEKCRYYTHLDCATSRNEPFMSILAAPAAGKIIKNYKDVEHPDVVHLPFPDPSHSIIKHWFFKEDGSSKFDKDTVNSHSLILADGRCTDITSCSSAPSRMKRISYHDPMKRTELLCNGCLRPITTAPIYVYADHEDEHCNFVLHEWCSRLRTKVNNHQCHPQHTLILHSKAPGKFFRVFDCAICDLPCNGFVYCCEECEYYIDVNCAFLPKEITHTCHPNHLFSLRHGKNKYIYCIMCGNGKWLDNSYYFSCYNCDIHLHPECALLIPETTAHKCDKHPMKLSFLPIENHKSEYFCEICEEDLNPNYPFYHCHECMQSIHTACAPSIVRYETSPREGYELYGQSVYRFVNMKFGGTYSNTKMHPHPLSFVQGVESDGTCDKCGLPLWYQMIFKCLDCKFAIDINCCRRSHLIIRSGC